MPEIHNGVPSRLERRLEKTLRDEIRVDLMRVLAEQPASIRELAERFDERLSVIAPHVLELWKDGYVDPQEDDEGAPFADRRFRVVSFVLSEGEWEALSDDERHEATVQIFEGLIGEVLSAMRSGHLAARPDSHQSWMPMAVDEEGWRETTALLERTFREANTIKVRSAERLREAGDEGTQMVVSMLGFERSR
jgi:DNA-binding transcriptional ArsR family regulator